MQVFRKMDMFSIERKQVLKELRRKVILPVFQLSELTTEDDPHALKRVINQGKGHPALTYQYRIKLDEQAERSFSYNLFPVVLDQGEFLGPLAPSISCHSWRRKLTPS